MIESPVSIDLLRREADRAFQFPESELPAVAASCNKPEEIIELFEHAGLPHLAETASINAGELAEKVLGNGPIYRNYGNLVIAGYLVDIADQQTKKYEGFTGSNGNERRDYKVKSNTAYLNAQIAEKWPNYGSMMAGGDQGSKIKMPTAVDCALARITKIGHFEIDYNPERVALQAQSIGKLVGAVGLKHFLEGTSRMSEQLTSLNSHHRFGELCNDKISYSRN
jgi:hypothetical protein